MAGVNNKDGKSPTMPATHYVAITPHDTTRQNANIRALYVGVSGDIVVTSPKAPTTEVTFKSVPVGVLPIEVYLVKATGTTATDIVGLI